MTAEEGAAAGHGAGGGGRTGVGAGVDGRLREELMNPLEWVAFGLLTAQGDEGTVSAMKTVDKTQRQRQGRTGSRELTKPKNTAAKAA